MAEQIILPRRVTDGNGDPIAGAKLRAFIKGTSTAEVIYSDEALTTAHPVPLLADAEGVFPPIWHAGDHGVKIEVLDASDVNVAWSPLDPVPMTSKATDAANISFTPTASNPATDVQDAIERLTPFGVDFDEVPVDTSKEFIIPEGCKKFEMILDNIQLSATEPLQIQFRKYLGTYITSGYSQQTTDNTNGTVTGSSGLYSHFFVTNTIYLGDQGRCRFTVQGVKTPGGMVTILGERGGNSGATDNYHGTYSGQLNDTGEYDAFRLFTPLFGWNISKITGRVIWHV